jgi:beta-glucosidase
MFTRKKVFPQSIAMAATFNPLLMQDVASAIAAEARAYGVHMCLSPVAEPAREVRWGRCEETFGEDTYLASRMTISYVKGMQGSSLSSNHSVVSEPKHFVGYSNVEGGRNLAPSHTGARELRTDYLPIFEAAIKDGGALGIMSSYNEVDGIPISGSKYYLTDILRGELGFKGFVLSGNVQMQLQ